MTQLSVWSVALVGPSQCHPGDGFRPQLSQMFGKLYSNSRALFFGFFDFNAPVQNPPYWNQSRLPTSSSQLNMVERLFRDPHVQLNPAT